MSVALAFLGAISVLLLSLGVMAFLRKPSLREELERIQIAQTSGSSSHVRQSARKKFQAKLDRAGIRLSPINVLTYYVLTCVVLVMLLSLTSGVPWLALLLGVGVPTVSLSLALGRLADRRQAKLDRQVLRMLTILVSLTAVGQPVEAAMEQAADEIGNPLGHELGLIVQQVRVGTPLPIALQSAAKRLGNRHFASLSDAVSLFSQSGGNLLPILRKLEEQVSIKLRNQASISAKLAQTRLVKLILELAPVGLLLIEMLVARSQIHGLSHHLGLVCLIGALVLVVLGAGISGQMIKRTERLAE